MPTVFEVFQPTAYTYLSVKRDSIAGTIIDSQTDAEGIFKLRSGTVAGGTQGTMQGSATLHIKPTEPFASDDLVGNGIRCGRDYEIVGQTAGHNYQTGIIEHYQLTLNPTEYS